MLRSETGRRRLPVLAALGALAVLAQVRPRRVVVEGDSMAPVLRPGDRLLVVHPFAGFPSLRPGAIVAVRDPRTAERMLVKRLVGHGGMWLPAAEPAADGAVPSLPDAAQGPDLVVFGEDGGHSTDSRTFGPVPRRCLVGRAVYRYAPGDRSGILTT